MEVVSDSVQNLKAFVESFIMIVGGQDDSDDYGIINVTGEGSLDDYVMAACMIVGLSDF